MPCDPTVFEDIPISSLLDADERAVLAEHVELRQFQARHRIYKPGDPGGEPTWCSGAGTGRGDRR
jgi:hypothetical protein